MIFWLLDLVLFTTILSLFVWRWVITPHETLRMFEHDVEMTTYLSTVAIAAATLIELVALEVGATWRHWEIVSFALWWGSVALSLTSCFTTYWILIRHERVHLSNLAPQLLYPVTGILATATCGAVIVKSTPLSVKLSMPIIVVSYMLLGLGQNVENVHNYSAERLQASTWVL